MKIKISAKCSDLFAMFAGDAQYQGYVPDFFPGDHFGDYVILEIDTETGRILNWPDKLSDSEIVRAFASDSNRSRKYR